MNISMEQHADGTIVLNSGCLIKGCKHKFVLKKKPKPGGTVNMAKMRAALFKMLRLHYARDHP